jgi:hypothetical protein
MRDETVRLFTFCLVLGIVALIAAAEFFGDLNSKYLIGGFGALAALGFAKPGWARRLVEHAADRWAKHDESFYFATLTVAVGLSLWSIVWTVALTNGLIAELPFGKVGWVASVALSAAMSFLFFPWDTLQRIFAYCERRAQRYGTLPRVWFKAISTGTVGGLNAALVPAILLNIPLHTDVLLLAIVASALVAFFVMPNPDWQSGIDRLTRKFAAKPWESAIKRDAWRAVSEQVNRQTASEIQRLQAALTQSLAALSAEITALQTQLAAKSDQDQRHAAALQNVQDRVDRMEGNLTGQIEKSIEDFSRKPVPKFTVVSNVKTFAEVVAQQLAKGKTIDSKSDPDGGAES